MWCRWYKAYLGNSFFDLGLAISMVLHINLVDIRPASQHPFRGRNSLWWRPVLGLATATNLCFMADKMMRNQFTFPCHSRRDLESPPRTSFSLSVAGYFASEDLWFSGNNWSSLPGNVSQPGRWASSMDDECGRNRWQFIEVTVQVNGDMSKFIANTFSIHDTSLTWKWIIFQYLLIDLVLPPCWIQIRLKIRTTLLNSLSINK